MDSLKHTAGWIQDSFPRESYGDIYMVEDWVSRSPHDRRTILESSRLIYTEQEEIMLGLKGVQLAPEPVMW
jgi:hypothetical protein